ASRRRTQTRDASFEAYVWVPGGGGWPTLPHPLEVPEGGGGTTEGGSYQTVYYMGERREEYEYRADGALMTVRFAETDYTDNGDGTVTPGSLPSGLGTAPVRASYGRDAMGQVLQYQEFDRFGMRTQHRYSIYYDLRGNIEYESTSQLKYESGAPHTYVTNTDNHYNASGLLTRVTTTSTRDSTWLKPTSLDFYHGWWDEARVTMSVYDKDTSGSNTNWVSTYYYDGLGRPASVDINDERRRTVSFAYTPEGQILNRKERSAVTNNPEDQHYFVAGVQTGELTNNSYIETSRIDYAQSIVQHSWSPNPTPAPFRWNTAGGVTGARFGGAGYDYINSDGNGSASSYSRHTVRDGDTLQTIAAGVWGDSSLWYLIAQANGLDSSSQLVAGQSLILPDRVTNVHNNAETFKVYDPNASLGDLSPTVSKPPKKANKCGGIGQLLVALVAVAVSIALPHLSAFFAKGAGLIIGGMISSAVSQAFGVATGIQNKFDWKGVAMAGITAGVGLGVDKIIPGAIGGSAFLGDVVRGAAGSAISQGIGVATGLQQKFSWAGVAAAGVSAGVSGAIGRAMTPGAGGHEGAHLTRSSRTPPVEARMLGGAAGALAGATTRSIITGTSFGDNILAVLPDVIANTIGLAAEDAIARLQARAASRAAAAVHSHPAADPASDALPPAAAAEADEPVEEEEVVITGTRNRDEEEASRGVAAMEADAIVNHRQQDAVQAASRARPAPQPSAPTRVYQDGETVEVPGADFVIEEGLSWRDFLEHALGDPVQRLQLPDIMAAVHLQHDGMVPTTRAAISAAYAGDPIALANVADQLVVLSQHREDAPRFAELSYGLYQDASGMDDFASAAAALVGNDNPYRLPLLSSDSALIASIRPEPMNFNPNAYSWQGRNYTRETYPGPVISVDRYSARRAAIARDNQMLDRLRGSPISGIPYGIAMVSGADQQTLDNVYAISSAADQAITARAAGARPLVRPGAGRLGPYGVDPARHNANVLVRDAEGRLIHNERFVSGNMTAAERALGYPRGTNLSHTEARATRQLPLEPGQTMIITGQRPPCNACKGAMNTAAGRSGATIRYQWRQDGRTRTWTTTGR
ncbi:MAG TPA: LysM peptidoglycan-binding domain-containing protein, partial [Allosphingosinicella sp.]|nr:LysM peptidoglycan-binding domain-containing protein [Allosphingosinicella sp.]